MRTDESGRVVTNRVIRSWGCTWNTHACAQICVFLNLDAGGMNCLCWMMQLVLLSVLEWSGPAGATRGAMHDNRCMAGP